MPTLRRLLLAASTLAVAVALVAVPSAIAVPDQPAAFAGKKKGAGKGTKKPSCKKGYVAKKVKNKKGKRVWRCVKKPSKPTPCRTASASCAIPSPQGLFEAPGKQLNGDETKPFLEKYLLNSTFTDCVPGWPSCSVEQRYSHAADSSFHYCRLTSASGADINSVGTYGVDNARVEPDGSWIFHEIVSAYGNESEYEWKVSATGVVTGAYRFQPGSSIEQIGPLQYVGGVAKDCSY